VINAGFEITELVHPSKQYQDNEKRGNGDLDHYHSYDELSSFLDSMQQNYPSIAKKISIGTSVQGKQLWGMRITDNINVKEFEPEFKYIANMHGDETVGREITIALIQLLLTAYGQSESVNSYGPQVTKLVDNTDIYIIPSMNPDGFERGTRSNKNLLDLNRNFPDLRFPGRSTGSIQPETNSVMNFTLHHNFVLSANFHGGSVVANYPYDGNTDRISGRKDPTPDDDLFQYISLVYSNAHRTMHLSSEFPNGITNGAEWYVLYGGMQDWNYKGAGCMEITIELSDIKYPLSRDLPQYWNDNRNAMLAYMEQVHTGIKGTIQDINGNPIGGATITVQGRDFQTTSEPTFGGYYRLLRPGMYQITVSASGFISKTQQVNVPFGQKIFEAVQVNFRLSH